MSLEGRSNAYNQIEKWFNENPEIKKYYEETQKECFNEQCFGTATIIIITIEKLLNKIKNYEDIEV